MTRDDDITLYRVKKAFNLPDWERPVKIEMKNDQLYIWIDSEADGLYALTPDMDLRPQAIDYVLRERDDYND